MSCHDVFDNPTAPYPDRHVSRKLRLVCETLDANWPLPDYLSHMLHVSALRSFTSPKPDCVIEAMDTMSAMAKAAAKGNADDGVFWRCDVLRDERKKLMDRYDTQAKLSAYTSVLRAWLYLMHKANGIDSTDPEEIISQAALHEYATTPDSRRADELRYDPAPEPAPPPPPGANTGTRIHSEGLYWKDMPRVESDEVIEDA